MKKRIQLFMSLLLCSFALFSCASAAETVIPPAYEVPVYVTQLLEIASNEIGYTEGAHGYSKYGEWSGDPYAQWCAEFLCWCVDQVDQQNNAQLLGSVYPLYSGSNSGRSWFIKQGRYIVRNGNLDGWGYQWLKGEDHFLTTGDYIPQPGDWMFLTWTSNTDTDHVAMVEYCTKNEDGNVTIHVIEGNNPASVQRNTYALTYTRILGYGTVHDCADWTMRAGNSGEKVRQLQQKLVILGFMQPEQIDGSFGGQTNEALKSFQASVGIKANGIANIATQAELDRLSAEAVYNDPATWQVQEDDEDDLDPSALMGILSSGDPDSLLFLDPDND